jgi:hypothetical protein
VHFIYQLLFHYTNPRICKPSPQKPVLQPPPELLRIAPQLDRIRGVRPLHDNPFVEQSAQRAVSLLEEVVERLDGGRVLATRVHGGCVFAVWNSSMPRHRETESCHRFVAAQKTGRSRRILGDLLRNFERRGLRGEDLNL